MTDEEIDAEVEHLRLYRDLDTAADMLLALKAERTKDHDHHWQYHWQYHWQEYLAERAARMEANGREAAWKARAEKAEYEAKRWKDVAEKQASWETLWAEQVSRAEAAEKALREIATECSTFPIKNGLAFRCESIARAALEAKP